MTKNVAIAIAESKFYESLPDTEVAWFQLNEKKLCMPFDVFHKAIEKALDRPVWTHEMGYPETLIAEFIAKHGQPE